MNESLKSAIEILDKEFTASYEEYIRLHKELDPYRGKEVGPHEQEINAILNRIQEKFTEIFPVLSFVGRRYEFSVNVVNEYTKFIDDLKKAGAKEQGSIS